MNVLVHVVLLWYNIHMSQIYYIIVYIYTHTLYSMHISSMVQTANSGFGWPLGRGHRSCRSCSISVPAQRNWSPSSRMSTAPWGSRGCGDIRTNDSGTVWMKCGSGCENSFKKAPPFWWDYSCCWNYSVAYDFLTLSSPHKPSSSVIRPLSLLKMTALLKMPPYGWGTLTITDVDKVGWVFHVQGSGFVGQIERDRDVWFTVVPWWGWFSMIFCFVTDVVLQPPSQTFPINGNLATGHNNSVEPRSNAQWSVMLRDSLPRGLLMAVKIWDL